MILQQKYFLKNCPFATRFKKRQKKFFVEKVRLITALKENLIVCL